MRIMLNRRRMIARVMVGLRQLLQHRTMATHNQLRRRVAVVMEPRLLLCLLLRGQLQEELSRELPRAAAELSLV